MILANANAALTENEITFVKFLGILLMLLWVAYLLKELLSGHRRDPHVDSLNAAVTAMTTTVTQNSTRMELLERRLNELIGLQREDVRAVFDRIQAMQDGINAVLREHEHDIARTVRPK